MPTTEHEAPLQMIRNQPQLVPAILRTVFGLDVPDEGRVTLASESYADMNPAELRCDATVLLDDPEKPSLGVVVESQLRFKEEKTFSWPAYLALLRQRRKCAVTLLVYCHDQARARACAAPIDMGHPGWVLKPLTFYPGMLPPVTTPDQAVRLPELSALSAPAHADGPQARDVLSSLAAAIDSLPRDIGALYYDHVVRLLSDAARKTLEEIVKTENYQWQSEFAITHRAEGRAEGEAEAVLLVLEARGIAVPDKVRERVSTCTDLGQLKQWVRRAATVDTVEDLFI